MKEEKGIWEKIIRSKLYDFETDVNPDDWDIISGNLPEGKSVRFHPYHRYGYITAAAIAALSILGGLYFYSHNDHAPATVAVIDNSGTDTVVDDSAIDAIVEKPVSNMVDKERLVAEAFRTVIEQPAEMNERKNRESVETTVNSVGESPMVSVDNLRKTSQDSPVRLESLKIDEADTVVGNIIDIELAKLDEWNGKSIQAFENTALHEKSLIADASSKIKPRRWGFGMGGGSYAVSPTSGNAVPSNSFLRSDKYIGDEEVMKIRDDGFIKLRSGSEDADVSGSSDGAKTRPYEVPSGKIKHKIPVSAGLGVSYYLNNRWSLQSGITYTILRSEWNTNDLVGDLAESKQNLQYIGVPLSVSYKIAEWNRFQIYASAGGMCEFNIAGTYKETIMSENLKRSRSEPLHMDELMWSVNARAGINYPLWRFINVYAETGASYYFDNKSEIKTIRSDKPFNVSLQAGIRLGF
jgi:hypothetical protein